MLITPERVMTLTRECWHHREFDQHHGPCVVILMCFLIFGKIKIPSAYQHPPPPPPPIKVMFNVLMKIETICTCTSTPAEYLYIYNCNIIDTLIMYRACNEIYIYIFTEKCFLVSNKWFVA